MFNPLNINHPTGFSMRQMFYSYIDLQDSTGGSDVISDPEDEDANEDAMDDEMLMEGVSAGVAAPGDDDRSSILFSPLSSRNSGGCCSRPMNKKKASSSN